MLARTSRPIRWTLGALALGALGFMTHTAEADIYTYTDAQGNVVISSKPQSGKAGGKLDKISGKNGKKKTVDILPIMPSDHSPERHHRYDSWIREGARLYRLPEEFIRAIIKCESDFDPRVVSPTGAQGLMQLMPVTADEMEVRDAFDPRQNILGGARYLRILVNTFDGSVALALAAYHAGASKVDKYGGIPPYPDTQKYVAEVIRLYRRYKEKLAEERAAAAGASGG